MPGLEDYFNGKFVANLYLEKLHAAQNMKSYQCVLCITCIEDLASDEVCEGCLEEMKVDAEAHRIISEQ